MNATRGIITALDGDYALVRSTEGGGCGRCSEEGGCGGANISQMLCSTKERTWRVLNPRAARIGEEVTVVVEEGALRSGATLIYGLPLVFFIGGAILGASLYGEPGGISGGIVGLFLAWAWVWRRVRQRHCDTRFQPHIL